MGGASIPGESALGVKGLGVNVRGLSASEVAEAATADIVSSAAPSGAPSPAPSPALSSNSSTQSSCSLSLGELGRALALP